MDPKESGLRQRAIPPNNDDFDNKYPSSSSSSSFNRKTTPKGASSMAVRQRPAIAYSRLPGASGPVAGRSSLQNYRNTILTVLCVTILYTAFLYRSPGALVNCCAVLERQLPVLPVPRLYFCCGCLSWQSVYKYYVWGHSCRSCSHPQGFAIYFLTNICRWGSVLSVHFNS